jgi:hypothetical protein
MSNLIVTSLVSEQSGIVAGIVENTTDLLVREGKPVATAPPDKRC